MRMPRDFRVLGVPLALLYAGVVALRHWAYDRGWLPSRRGPLHTLVLGNLTVGGTGKTPHARLMVQELEALLGPGTVGLLSRGYGRRSRGFRWVRPGDSAAEVGDEPLLLRRMLPGIAVAVCEDRLAGLERMRAEAPALRWVVLDDALQHRRLRPDIGLLLLDDTQPVALDFPLPAGRLRDLPGSMARADAALLTRLPLPHTDADPLARALARQGWPAARPYWGTSMQLHFPAPTTPPAPPALPRAIALAGIARPERFFQALTPHFDLAATFAYRDHRPYTPADQHLWHKTAARTHCTLLVTTEKDAVRLSSLPPFSSDLVVLTIPMEATFHQPESFRNWLREKVTTIENRPC